MANDPDLILADEPTSTPDSKTGERVMHLFQNLNQDQRKTIVLSTHNAKLSIETNRGPHHVRWPLNTGEYFLDRHQRKLF